jgi:hypothetical protein
VTKSCLRRFKTTTTTALLEHAEEKRAKTTTSDARHTERVQAPGAAKQTTSDQGGETGAEWPDNGEHRGRRSKTTTPAVTVHITLGAHAGRRRRGGI